MSTERKESAMELAARESEAVTRLSRQELALEGGELLPDKEVLSILDLLVNIDLALDLAAPIDLAVAANANVAAPIDAAAGANVLSFGSTATAAASQGTDIDQNLVGVDAIASATQVADVTQDGDGTDAVGTGGTETTEVGGGAAAGGGSGTEGGATGGTPTTEVSGGGSGAVANTEVVENGAAGLLDGPLLNVDVNVNLDSELAAPVGGAVALNANVAAPIDAAVAANIASVGSNATAIAEQTALITQGMEDATASATANQDAQVDQ